MFLATLGIAVSLTTTTAFLMFYSVSLPVKKFLESLDYMGKMIMLFFYTFAFVGCEMPAGTALYYAFMFILVTILVLNLVLVQYAMGRAVSYWTSMAVLIAIYISDFLFNSSPKEKDVFYIPMFVELAILGCGYLLYVYQVPERFCRGSKFVQLYTTGFIIFTIMLINFIFEAHNILYYTIKLNSGYYEDDSEIDWWKTTNIYHKS